MQGCQAGRCQVRHNQLFQQAKESKDGRHKGPEKSNGLRSKVKRLLKAGLKKNGFQSLGMEDVWKGALCVHHPERDERAAICIQNAGESHVDWNVMVERQRILERTGWACLRVDAISLAIDYDETLHRVIDFLAGIGIEPVKENDGRESGEAMETDSESSGDMSELDNPEEFMEVFKQWRKQKRSKKSPKPKKRRRIADSSDEEEQVMDE